MVRILIFLFAVNFTLNASAAVLFEGYYKILLDNKHVGFSIARYTFDEKAQTFHSTYFLKTNKDAGEITESLKATADANLNPIVYEYTNVQGKNVKTIDYSVKKSRATGTIKENGKTTKISSKLPEGTFCSTFLIYLMLKGKEGLKENSNYNYQAIAEEDATLQKGLAKTFKISTYKNIEVFKIENTFKDSNFTSWVSKRGEVLATEMTSTGIKTELVSYKEAINDQMFSTAVIKALFGDVPEGKANVLAASTSEIPSKANGVPQGQGIQLKTEKSGN